ncbi:MAG TPA: response regulator transcription factor [Actinomycetota bacterium]|nr:response regulator transcription factor [Actinomycetota bacterium]
MTGSPIRVEVVEDHPLARYGLVRALEAAEDVVVVGEASDGEEALELLEGEPPAPDVVLVDLTLLEDDGIELTRRVAEEHPDVGVIVLGPAEEERAPVAEAVLAGARGYLAKPATEGLVEAVRRVARGEVVIDPRLARAFLERMAREADRLHWAQTPTARELEIAERFASGESVEEIAGRYHLSAKDVRTHLGNFARKTLLADRLEGALEDARRSAEPSS